MLEVGIALLWLTLLLPPVYMVKRWVMLYLHGLGVLLLGTDFRAIWLRFLVLAPGIILHEVSHWLLAKLLLVPTGAFSLGPSQATRKGRSMQVTMGYVMIGHSDPLRSSLIGMAPFVFGTLAIIGLAQVGFHQALGTTLSAPARLAQVFSHLPDLFRVADVWFWLYIVFSISNSLTPSESDRRGWGTLALYLIGLGAVALVVFGVPQVPESVVDATQRALDVLLFAFALTLIVDVVMGVVIYGLYWVTSRLRGERVYFR